MLAVRVERPAPLHERLGDVVGQVRGDRPPALLVDERDLVRRVPRRRAPRASRRAVYSTSPGASRRSARRAGVTDVVGEVRVDPPVDLGLRDALAHGRSRAAPGARCPGRAAGRRSCADRSRAAARSRCARSASTRARRGRRACACRRARGRPPGRAPARSSPRSSASQPGSRLVPQSTRQYAVVELQQIRVHRRHHRVGQRQPQAPQPVGEPVGAHEVDAPPDRAQIGSGSSSASIRRPRTGRAGAACRASRSGGAAARR